MKEMQKYKTEELLQDPQLFKKLIQDIYNQLVNEDHHYFP